MQSSFFSEATEKVISDTGLGKKKKKKTWWENSNLPDTHSSFSPWKQRLLWQEGCQAENKCVFVIIRISPLAKNHTDPATKGFKFQSGDGSTELSLRSSENFDIVTGIRFIQCASAPRHVMSACWSWAYSRMTSFFRGIAGLTGLDLVPRREIPLSLPAKSSKLVIWIVWRAAC